LVIAPLDEGLGVEEVLEEEVDGLGGQAGLEALKALDVELGKVDGANVEKPKVLELVLESGEDQEEGAAGSADAGEGVGGLGEVGGENVAEDVPAGVVERRLGGGNRCRAGSG
jgi:hypothetical protein